MIRLLLIFCMVAGLAACTEDKALDKPLEDLGAFSLGHNIVVAPKMQKVPISRDATKEEWIEALTKSIGDRFGRYEGESLYHFGISVEGFVLAPPGVPVVLAPKSGLIILVTVWDDAAGKKLNETPEQLVIFEDFNSASFVGSGYVMTREEQLEQLAFKAAHRIEQWLVEMRKEKGWFEARETDAPIEDAQTEDTAPVTDIPPQVVSAEE